MRPGRFFRLSVLAFVLLFTSVLGATDFSGKYRANNAVLELIAGSDGYTGTFTIKEKSYPVVAKEKEGALQGYFTANETQYNFTAKLADTKLSMVSDTRTVELTRDKA